MKILLVILLLSVATTCQNNAPEDKGVSNTEVTQKMENNNKVYPFEVLMQGQVCAQNDAQIHVIKEPQALNEVFEWINEGRTPKLEMPTVNYDEDIIISLFMGQKNYGGYSINVSSIEETTDELVVYVKETEPSGKFAVAAITQPFCVVKIKKTDKKIRFVKNEN